MYLRIFCEIWWMRGKKRTALVMGSQKEKSSLSTPRLKTLRDNKVGVMTEDGIGADSDDWNAQRSVGCNQTDRSQYFPLLQIYFFPKVISRSASPVPLPQVLYLCITRCTGAEDEVQSWAPPKLDYKISPHKTTCASVLCFGRLESRLVDSSRQHIYTHCKGLKMLCRDISFHLPQILLERPSSRRTNGTRAV